MRRSARVGHRFAALVLVFALGGSPLCLGQMPPAGGSLTGRIFEADSVTPRSGVLVKVANLATSKVFTSTQTDDAGRYNLASLPSGQYQVAVETNEGLYVNNDQVPVMQGRKTLFSLALSRLAPDGDDPEEPEGEQEPEEGEPEDDEDGRRLAPPPETVPPDQGQGGVQRFFRSNWGTALSLGGGAVILGLLADSIAGETKKVDTIVSPSSSSN